MVNALIVLIILLFSLIGLKKVSKPKYQITDDEYEFIKP
jgi:hypothetical protein